MVKLTNNCGIERIERTDDQCEKFTYASMWNMHACTTMRDSAMYICIRVLVRNHCYKVE